MLDQQLNIPKAELQKEASVNWACLRNLYIQSGKTESIPEPDSANNLPSDWIKNAESEMKNYFQEIFIKLNANNKVQIQCIQNMYKEEIIDLKKRIERLQEIILSFKPISNQANRKNSTFQTPEHKSFDQKHIQTASTATKAKQDRAYIHIQQDQRIQDTSLLDPSQQESASVIEQSKLDNESQNGRSQNKKQRQQQYMEGIKRKLYQNSVYKQTNNYVNKIQKQIVIVKQPIVIPDIIIKDNYFQPISNTQKIINVPCRIHERILKELHEQVQRLRVYLQNVHDEQIQQPPLALKIDQLKQSQKRKNENPIYLVNLSANSQKHLQHQNDKLRKQKDSYLQELKYVRQESRYIKNLLRGVLQIHRHIYK